MRGTLYRGVHLPDQTPPSGLPPCYSSRCTVFAYSRIVGSRVMDPTTAHARFHHMGVYKLNDVKLAAGGGSEVHVLEFEDTEILRKPLSLFEFLSRGQRFGVATISPSPRLISAELLREVYQQSNGTE